MHFLAVRLRNVLFANGRRLRTRVSSMGRPVYLNLGSGPRGIDDRRWINVDGYSDANVHFLLDFNRPLPFADSSLDGVFCEHVIEHFSQEDGLNLAREILRCLRPGGVVRIIVPDAERVMRAYFDHPQQLAERRKTQTAIEAVNSYFRQRYEHQFLYDFETMELMLQRAGFTTVIRSSFRTSVLCLDVVLDHPKYEWESLYIESTRPPIDKVVRSTEAFKTDNSA